MMTWTPVIVSVLALLFAALSFWWMNWRPARLEVGDLRHFAAGKATEGAADEPNVVIVTLPLILFNSGARSLVIESLRLVGTHSTKIGQLEFERVDSHLGTVPAGEKSESDYFFYRSLSAPMKSSSATSFLSAVLKSSRTVACSTTCTLRQNCLAAAIGSKSKTLSWTFRTRRRPLPWVSISSTKCSTIEPPIVPNPSIERTRSGSAGLAFISFSAKPALPPRAAHVKR